MAASEDDIVVTMLHLSSDMRDVMVAQIEAMHAIIDAYHSGDRKPLGQAGTAVLTGLRLIAETLRVL